MSLGTLSSWVNLTFLSFFDGGVTDQLTRARKPDKNMSFVTDS